MNNFSEQLGQLINKDFKEQTLEEACEEYLGVMKAHITPSPLSNHLYFHMPEVFLGILWTTYGREQVEKYLKENM
jgi:hypothetical protein